MTFKENVVDVRNSQVVEIIRELWSFGIPVQVHEPLADPADAVREHGVTIQKDLAPADAVVLAVAHDSYRASGWPLVAGLLKNGRGWSWMSNAFSIRSKNRQALSFG